MTIRPGSSCGCRTTPRLAESGVVFGGDGPEGEAFSTFASLGNLSDDPTPLVDAIAIGYRPYSSADAGVGKVRLNTNDPESGLVYGTFPWVNLELFDPFDLGSSKYAYRNVVGVGDFNGDGLDDVLVATNGSGYVVLLH